MDLFFNFDWTTFLNSVGNNPFQAMLFFFLNGGWIILLLVMLWGVAHLWLQWRQNLFGAKKVWIVLAIDIPRMHEQGPRAVENAFAYLAGAHGPSSWTEKWIQGRTQDTISCEIVSIEGQVQFIIRTTRNLRDLAEASIYAQYPDAEITEVEDYTTKVPAHYPDEEWDLWGTEMIPAKHGMDLYPLKTYPFFEDKVSGEFKDPMSAFLESFSRLGPGEQAWYQIVLTPVAQGDFVKKSEALVKKIKGEKVIAKKTLLDHAVDLPLKGAGLVAEQLLGSGTAEKPKPPAKEQPKIMGMSQGEKDILSAVEMKAAKIVYLVKIRFVYVAKKQNMVKSRAANTFIGAIKQVNTNNMMSLKPESKKVGVNGTLWWFKKARNNERKTHLALMCRGRSNWSGTPNYYLNTEELATLWHFPHALQVKSPQLQKTESKRSEPPSNIPFG
ncbi:MAG: hypothetical protein WA001_03420 [Patescibacteria group bacterium]